MAGKAVPANRRFALKAATDSAHAGVEDIVRTAGMFDTLDGYRRYVAATWALRTRFETLLDANNAAAIWPLWPSRRIAPLAARDMGDLGVEAAVPTFQASKLNDGELLGILYVLEGSALGARLLVKSVSGLGLSATHGARHMHAQAGDTSAWRSFLDVLETSHAAPCHDSSLSVFDAFARAYEQASG